ncbi:MAG: methyltransferase domain-containing protein [Limibacillus sp.]|jgi:NADH dehydrogenase [ubiquinone] 1 alpha subcomplex assembly factor 5
MTGNPSVFDRRLLRLRRERAAGKLDHYGFLFEEAGERLLDRLDDIRRGFPDALDLGARDGTLGRLLRGRGGIERLVQCELSEGMARRASATGASLVADEEFLPFAPASFDLVMSLFSLHWVNDLPGALLQARQALKPDGLFLASLLGGETLWELRDALMEAEMEVEGGVSPRLSPVLDLADAAGLLQRAGFALPVADQETLVVDYPNALKLLDDLRGMGESNANLQQRKGFTRRATLLRAAEIYQDRFQRADGRIPASFQIFTLTAWAPDEAQPKPLRPGSASQRLADALDSEEQSAGDKAAPKEPEGGR